MQDAIDLALLMAENARKALAEERARRVESDATSNPASAEAVKRPQPKSAA